MTIKLMGIIALSPKYKVWEKIGWDTTIECDVWFFSFFYGSWIWKTKQNKKQQRVLLEQLGKLKYELYIT